MAEVDLIRAVLALLFVLGLIGILTWIARRLRLPGFSTGGPNRRLEVVETLVVDPRHKVVLMRADGLEHLVLLGPSAPLLLERRDAAAPPEDPAP